MHHKSNIRDLNSKFFSGKGTATSRILPQWVGDTPPVPTSHPLGDVGASMFAPAALDLPPPMLPITASADLSVMKPIFCSLVLSLVFLLAQ